MPGNIALKFNVFFPFLSFSPRLSSLLFCMLRNLHFQLSISSHATQENAHSDKTHFSLIFFCESVFIKIRDLKLIKDYETHIERKEKKFFSFSNR